MPDWLNPKILVALGVALALLIVFLAKFGILWLQAYTSGAPVGMFHLVGMALRHVPAAQIVSQYIAARRAGLDLTLTELEALHLAGGHPSGVVRALIAARQAGLALDFRQACAIDLSGRDVVAVVDGAVRPKVLPCCDPFTRGDVIEARSSDGLRIRLKAGITVRTSLARALKDGSESTVSEWAARRLIAIAAGRTAAESLDRPAELGTELIGQEGESGSALEIVAAEVLVREGAP